MDNHLQGKLLEKMRGRGSSTAYTALEVFWGHVLETGHRLSTWESGNDICFGCHECVVTCVVDAELLEKEGVKVLAERGKEIIKHINSGGDFREFFGIRTRFERVI